jgi:hypothetical protein
MQWKYYWRNVVQRYSVKIEGWPMEIPFSNLSEASSTLTDLESLLAKWRNGITFWRKLSADELEELDSERERQLDNGDISPPAPRRPRSDRGKKRPRSTVAVCRKSTKKKPRSNEFIPSDEDNDGTDNDGTDTGGAGR